VPARIAVVHDDPTFRDPLADSLRATGVDVATFVDSMAAWGALDAATRIEILVTRIDFGLNQPHGVALAQSARIRCPGLRVLFAARQQFRGDVEGVGMLLPLLVSVPEVTDVVGCMLGNDSLGRID
jgi:DNA-binding response OmpR family regulator